MINIYESLCYIAPDSNIYYFSDLDIFTMEESGFGMPEIEYITQRGPYQHGMTLIDYRLKERTIQVVVRRNGCSRESFWSNRQTLIDVIRPNRQYGNNPSRPITAKYFSLGKLRKVLPDGSRRDIDVLLQSGPDFSNRSPSGSGWDEWGFSATLRFTAPDPSFYDPTIKTVTWTLSTGNNLIFPVTFPITFGSDLIDNNITVEYLGTYISYPTITITGPISGVTITNLHTNEKLRLNYIVSTGETVVISLGYGNKTVVSSIYGNLIDKLSNDSDLATFHLAPAAEGGQSLPGTHAHNDINVVGAVAAIGVTSVKIEYYDRYIAI